MRAEETYGLFRPGPNEETVYVHRQTTSRFAIPVGHNVLPEEILDDIARWYNDIHDRWKDITWWLCRVHSSSMSSRLPILGYTNYVLVHENDYLAADMRPHGLIELVFGADLFLFPTFLPRWINWPILQTFLEPISSRAHFGISMHGFYNGRRLCQRLVRCANGFFIQVHYASTPFLLNELFQSAPLHAVTLHTVTEYLSARAVRWSTVYIAGGYTLIFSRYYERVDDHSKGELIGGLHQRFPDLVTENFDLVKVHHTAYTLDPVVNHARQRFVVAPVEEGPHVIVVLKLDLPPYMDIGAIFAPPVLDKGMLVIQTGIDLVCGPDGELCVCYHNGWELHRGEMTTVDDGDFIVCWFDPDPKETTGSCAVAGLLLFGVEAETYPSAFGCAGPSGSARDTRH